MSETKKELTPIEIFEHMAAALESGIAARLTAACGEVMNYMSTYGAHEMVEPLLIAAPQMPDPALRRQAYRMAVDWGKKQKIKNEAIRLFTEEVEKIAEPAARLAAYLDMKGARYKPEGFMGTVIPKCLDLAAQFSTPHARVDAYEAIHKFSRNSEWCDRAACGLLGNAASLPVEKQVQIYGGLIFGSLRRDMHHNDKDLVKAASLAYVTAIAQLPKADARAQAYGAAFEYHDLTPAQQKQVVDGFLDCVAQIRNGAMRVDMTDRMLRAIESGGPDRVKNLFLEERLKIVNVILNSLDAITDFEERIQVYHTAAEHSPSGSDEDRKAADSFERDVKSLVPEKRLSVYDDMVRSLHYTARSGHLHRAALVGWRDQLELRPAQERFDYLHGRLHKLYTTHDEGFVQTFTALYEKAIEQLPDDTSRIRASMGTIGATESYSAHPLEKPAMAAFEKYMRALPRAQREKTCWNLMDHDREQSMLPDPPFESLLFQLWHEAHEAGAGERADERKSVLGRIRTHKVAKAAP